jgi:hypothetical protein
MSQLTRPTSYLDWTAGPGTNVTAPPMELKATGWQPGMPVPAAYVNYNLWLVDQWIQFLSEGINATVLATSLDHSMRLIGGGTFSWDASTQILAWSAPLYVAVPSMADTGNTIPAGQVTLAAGSVAYVAVNLPFTTTGDLQNGSATVKNLGFESGINVGQGVTGTGIAAGTTVSAVTDTTVTLSQAATQTVSQATLTFASSGSLTVSVAASASLLPNPVTTIIARSVGSAVGVGAGTSQMWLRDKEKRALASDGYVSTLSATAGETLPALRPVYVSTGAADGSRTAGSVYSADGASVLRSQCVGFTYTAATQGQAAPIVNAGYLTGFASLTAGSTYYLDPSAVGGITSTRPTLPGQMVAPVGVAVSTTTLLVRMGASAAVPVPQRANIHMGVLWSSNYSSAYRLYTAIDNVGNGGLGTLERHWTAPQNGSIVGYSAQMLVSSTNEQPGFYISANNTTAVVTIGLTAPAVLAPSTMTDLNGTFASGTYTFKKGDVLTTTFSNLRMTGINVQASLDILVEFTS